MKNLVYTLLALLILAGCNKEEQPLKEIQKGAPVFTSSFEEYDLDEKTKTYVDANVKLLWHEADEISIFTTTKMFKYLFDGKTGDNNGAFNLVGPNDQFVTGNSISANYAVYPYSSENAMSNEEVISLTLPATQQYAQNSFGRGANTMVAVTSGLNDYFLPFKNIGGYLLLKLYAEDVTVKSIYLTGNNGEKLAGDATVTAQYGKSPVVEMAGTATETIALDCGEGVKLGTSEEDPTLFWFVIPPTTFAKGITVIITDINGCTMTKSSTKVLPIERNQVNTMQAVEVATESVPSNQIWYTTTNEEVVELGNTEGFGASLTSNVYEYGKGVLSFSSSITAIPEGAFEDCAALTSVTIPQGVTDINNYAFKNCTNLESVKIGEKESAVALNTRSSDLIHASNTQSKASVIGEGAFWGCSSLTEIDIPKDATSIGASAFSGCSSLASIEIPSSVTTIEAEAFSDCSSLTSITIPENVETLGNGTFFGCTGLTDIYYMPETPPASGSSVFDSSTSNLTIHVPEASVNAYLEAPALNEFKDAIVGDADKVPSNEIWYTTLSNSTVTPNNSNAFGASIISNTYADGKGILVFDGPVTAIGDGAFNRNTDLATIELPESATSIGIAFSQCSNLVSVKMSEKLTSIGDYAFQRCSSLDTLYIPESVVEFGECAFNQSYNIKFAGNLASSDAKCLIKNGVLIAFSPGTTSTDTLSYSIPEGITSIGIEAFSNVQSLSSVTVPEGVTEIGGYAFASCSGLTSISLPASLATIGEGVFSKCSNLVSLTIPQDSKLEYIGKSCFRNCTNLKTLKVPSGVTYIFEQTFSNCSNLTSVELPDGITHIGKSAFINCTKLESIELPDNLETIDNQAFNFSGLTSVTIPGGVTHIGDAAFCKCEGLVNVICNPSNPPALGTSVFDENASGRLIHVPAASLDAYKGATNWSDYADAIVGETVVQKSNEIWYTSYDGAVVEPNAKDVFGANITSNTYANGQGVITFDAPVTSVGENAFKLCSRLVSITLPEGVTSLGAYAFNGCDYLESFDIPEGVTSIGAYTFAGCLSLLSITIPEGVTSIGDCAFNQCQSLGTFTSVTLPEGVTSIGKQAFYACSQLAAISIPNSVESIGEQAFSECSLLYSITLPNGVTSVGERTFENCSGLTSVTLPDSVTSIGAYAFYNCSQLNTISLPDGVTTIGESAFYGCGALNSIVIPGGVTNIGSSAFYLCSNLRNVYCKPSTPPTLGTGAFGYTSLGVESIYVPTASESAYKQATNWSNYASFIKGML